MISSIRRTALIADDHELFRAGLSITLKRDLGFDDVVEAGSLEEALELLAARPDISFACFDVGMPGIESAKDLRRVREAFPALSLAVVSASTAREDVLLALTAGVHGYIPKTMGIAAISRALRLVLDGHMFVPSFLAVPSPQLRPAETAATQPAKVIELTQRQREVLRLMAEGKSNKSIARALDLAEGTVKVHVNALFRALGVHNRVSAVQATVAQLGSAELVG